MSFLLFVQKFKKFSKQQNKERKKRQKEYILNKCCMKKECISILLNGKTLSFSHLTVVFRSLIKISPTINSSAMLSQPYIFQLIKIIAAKRKPKIQAESEHKNESGNFTMNSSCREEMRF